MPCQVFLHPDVAIADVLGVAGVFQAAVRVAQVVHIGQYYIVQFLGPPADGPWRKPGLVHGHQHLIPAAAHDLFALLRHDLMRHLDGSGPHIRGQGPLALAVHTFHSFLTST